ncbi:hypothetical protein FDECE_8203 [Fusarium decemcellulare]|nr:hypothetical protein FDECE_8203 [Fusarium decemcellulare]
MEPVSLAFGVVSLGMQLVQTAAAIRTQIEAYKSAAKELSTLSDKLDDIEAICYSLEAAFSCYEQAPKPWDVVLLRKLHKIMCDCCDKVTRLHQIVAKITSSQSTRRTPLNTMGTRFLQNRGALRKCNEELDQSLTSLHLHMTTNIFVMNLRPSPQASQQSQSLAVTNPSQTDPAISGSNSSDVIKQPRNRARSVVQSQKWGSSATVQEESSFLVGSPLLGLYAKLAIGTDDVAEFQKLLSKYSLTPASSLNLLDLTSGETDSFLGLALTARANRIHDYVIDQCPGLLHERQHLPLNYGILSEPWAYWNPRVDFTCVRTYIEARGDELTPTEFHALISRPFVAIHVEFCVKACKEYFSEEWEPFNRCLRTRIVDACAFLPLQEDFSDSDGWVSLIRQTIADGLDVHSKLPWHDQTDGEGLSALQELLYFTLSVEHGLRRAHRWVEMLQKAGVDVDRYLEQEIRDTALIWDELRAVLEHSSYLREFTVREYRGRKFPSWTTSYAASAAPELFTEFPHLVNWEAYGDIYVRPGSPEPHQAWKPPLQVGGGIVRAPLERLCLSLYRYPEPWTEEDRRIVEGLAYACDLMESRFERKRQKKLRKVGYLREFGALKLKGRIPGAWVD